MQTVKQKKKMNGKAQSKNSTNSKTTGETTTCKQKR